MKKLASPRANKSIKRIYLVIYDQQEFYGYEKFQTVCMMDDEDYENYVLSNNYSDYIVSVSDFRDAHGYIKEEILRLEKNRIPVNIWEILENIKPFKILPIEYITETK